jgi:hypothetical protein
MKKRKPVISDKKKRGEWTEMIFMVRATEHGLQVIEPCARGGNGWSVLGQQAGEGRARAFLNRGVWTMTAFVAASGTHLWLNG